jgi:hypothetical protein
MNVTFKDFQLINNWKPDLKGQKWGCCKDHKEQPMFIIDETTNRRYLNESPWTIRMKCCLLTFGTPFVHPIASIANLFYRIIKIATFSHFWTEKKGEKAYEFQARFADAYKDLLRIAAVPFNTAGLELAAIYGIIRPLDGRKIYASIERASYGSFILAPCFQPDPKFHALGGDLNKKDSF